MHFPCLTGRSQPHAKPLQLPRAKEDDRGGCAGEGEDSHQGEHEDASRAGQGATREDPTHRAFLSSTCSLTFVCAHLCGWGFFMGLRGVSVGVGCICVEVYYFCGCIVLCVGTVCVGESVDLWVCSVYVRERITLWVYLWMCGCGCSITSVNAGHL